MRRGKVVSALGATLLWLLWLCCPTTLWADELSVTPAFGYAGATVELSGCGFQAGEGVGVVLDGDAAGQDAADLAGCVRVKRATAPTTAPTVHLWSLSGQRSAATLQAVYAVNPGLAVAVPPSLPAAGGTFLTIPQAQAALGVTYRAAALNVAKLVDAGILRPAGRRRTAGRSSPTS